MGLTQQFDEVRCILLNSKHIVFLTHIVLFIGAVKGIGSRCNFQENGGFLKYCIINLIVVKHGNAILIFLIILLMESEVLGKVAVIDIAFGKVVVKDKFHVANNS